MALGAAGVTFVFHLLANPHYGFFRDELYFIICGRHPQFGYVDQPPVVPLLAAASQVFGASLAALRAISALFAAASVYVTCRLVQEFGGGSFAEVLAAAGVALAPILAGFGVLVFPDTVQIWAWPLMTLYVVRMMRGADARLWLAVGAVLGLTIETKYSVLFFALALLIGLALTRQRILATRWIAAGGALAGVIALPNLLWQALHGFPMLELLRNGQLGKNVVLDPLSYVVQQVLITNPPLALVWICGLIWTFARPNLRWLGIASVALIALMVAAHGKTYYGCAIYPALFAAGGTAVEGWTKRVPMVRAPMLALALISGLVFIPLGVPILSEQQFIAYSAALTKVLPQPAASEHHRQASLPQAYADMHGWPELAATVARVYDSLPPNERAGVAIKTSNYGEAAAIDFFGARYELPATISGHNQYFLWGPRGYTGDVLIDVDGDCGATAHVFRSAKLAARFSAPYVMPYEDDMPIMICRGIKQPLSQLWPKVKSYN
ncbi:MAG: glycosyltransferase family 39 protein [Candidatus Eremiobacteraeota bacterium]|nr:glycosyltransferase family 39 protein [Candidatus Eremiobacteraeota bacterium]